MSKTTGELLRELHTALGVCADFDTWHAELERAREQATDWHVEINSPMYFDHMRRLVYCDRWGVVRILRLTEETKP